MKNKTKINFIIDALLFALMMAISGIGLLLRFVLVHGSRRWEIYGGNVDLYLWGWDRHQWGALHLLLGFIFLGLLVLYVWKFDRQSILSDGSHTDICTRLYCVAAVCVYCGP
jgi:hypothetical protein